MESYAYQYVGDPALYAPGPTAPATTTPLVLGLDLRAPRARDYPCHGLRPTILGTHGDDVIRAGTDLTSSPRSAATTWCSGPTAGTWSAVAQVTTACTEATATTSSTAAPATTCSRGDGDDTLIGGPGDDTLVGGPRRDRLRGGAGKDRLKN